MTKVRFKFLTGDVNWREYGGKFISQKLHYKDDEIEFDYAIVKDYHPEEDTSDEFEPSAIGIVYMVAPDLVPEENKQSALAFWGWDPDRPEMTFELWVDVLSSHGTAGPVGNFEDHPQKVLREMNKLAQDVADYPLHYMGQMANQIGATVLDFMKGDIIPWSKK